MTERAPLAWTAKQHGIEVGFHLQIASTLASIGVAAQDEVGAEQLGILCFAVAREINEAREILDMGHCYREGSGGDRS